MLLDMYLPLSLIVVCFLKVLECRRGHHSTVNSRLNYFDTDLLRSTAEEQIGNVLVSPASIRAVLAMLMEGAEGETAYEIRRALRLSPNKYEYREQINMYLSALKTDTNGSYLQNANAIFVSEKLKVKREYRQMLRHIYFSDIFPMDFQNSSEATNRINDWGSNKTKGLIPVIVDQIQINPSIDMLVTNAMYFKGDWKYEFDSKGTSEGCFFVYGKCKHVPIMELQAELNYAFLEDLRAHAVELPYQGGNYSMLLLVPQDRDGSVSLIRDLPYLGIHQLLEMMEPTELELFLPRFSVDYSLDLVMALRNMRINTIFSASANLSGMFENELEPQLSNIFHRTHLQVTESGTVAAASTVSMVVPLINTGVQLKVDRPFLFFIRDKRIGVTLFEGRIEEPEHIM